MSRVVYGCWKTPAAFVENKVEVFGGNGTRVIIQGNYNARGIDAWNSKNVFDLRCGRVDERPAYSLTQSRCLAMKMNSLSDGSSTALKKRVVLERRVCTYGFECL